MGTSNHTSNIKVNNLCYQSEICKKKLARGSVSNKKALYIGDTHNTVIYVDKKKSEAECEVIKEQYLRRLA